MLYEFIKLIKNIQEYTGGKSQIYRGKICSSGVIINPLREQAAVYVAFYMYKIVRITEERKAVGGEGGEAVTAALVQCAQVRERRGSLVKRRNNLPV